MRTTRAQAIASRCIVAKVPVEVLTQILQYANIKPSDLASVAATCRYLRAIASPLLLQRIFFSANNKLSFAPLEALVGNAQKGALVRKLTIKEGKTSIPSNRAPIYSNLLSRALDVLLHLEMITIPFALLDQAVFTSIYNTPSITTLEILPAQLAQKAPTLQLSSRNAFPAPRPSPLIVPKLASQLSGNQSSAFCTAFLSDLLEFLTFHSISVEKIRFSYLHTKSSLGNFLTAHAFDALREVDITFLPAAFDRCTNWLTQVLAAQTSLETVTYNVMNAWDGFELGRGSWVGWANGALIFPVAALADAWRGVMVKRLMMRFTRTPGDDDPIASDVEIVVPTTTTLLPSQTRAISTNEPCIFTLSFAAEEGRLSKGIPTISWEDWTQHVAIFTSHEFLRALFLTGSVTPTPTITTTLACSPSCYATLLQTHPHLHAASELVGGYENLWELSVELNLERLRALAGAEQDYVLDVFWNVLGKKGVTLVDYEGTGVEDEEEGRRREIEFVSMLSGEKSVGQTLLGCDCFGCGAVTVEDPITAMRRCGVEEVRGALAALGGFDSEGFDARPPTQPIKPDSFETFLRSSA